MLTVYVCACSCIYVGVLRFVCQIESTARTKDTSKSLWAYCMLTSIFLSLIGDIEDTPMTNHRL